MLSSSRGPTNLARGLQKITEVPYTFIYPRNIQPGFPCRAWGQWGTGQDMRGRYCKASSVPKQLHSQPRRGRWVKGFVLLLPKHGVAPLKTTLRTRCLHLHLLNVSKGRKFAILGEAILLWVSSVTQRPFTSVNISETMLEKEDFFFGSSNS